MPAEVPASEPALLGVAQHLLLNELRRSPDTLLDSVIALAEQAISLDTGSPRSSTATVILFLTRLCSRLDSYISMLLKCNANATYLDAKTARDIHVDAKTCERLATTRERLRVLLWGDLVKITASWIRTLAKECENGPANANYDRIIAENTKLRCVLEAHHCLALRNIQVSDLDADRAKHLVVSATFLTTRFEFNGGSNDALLLPETEVFEVR